MYWLILGHSAAMGQDVQKEHGAVSPPIPTGTTEPIQPPPASPDTLQPPSPSRAMELYQIVDGWVRACAVPDAAMTDGREGRLVATSLVLRVDGQIVGRGVACGDDGLTTVRAARAAIAEAATRLPHSNDVLGAEQVKAWAPGIRISLELSGTLIPITPATFGELDLEILQGIEGIAARVGTQMAAVFPASMLTTGTSPSDALVKAISTATGDPTAAIKINSKSQPPQIAADRGATYYKFAASHLAQLPAGGQPVFLFRGGRIVSAGDISTVQLREFADRLTDCLVRWNNSHRDQPDWPRGTYFPSRDSYDPPVASLAEYAVATYAIHRYLATKALFQNRGADDWKWVRSGPGDLAYARFGPQRLTEFPVANQVAGPVFSAMRALVAMAPMESRSEEAGAALAALAPVEADLASAYSITDGWAKAVPENTRAFVAFVLARRATLISGEADAQTKRELADAAVRSIYRDTKPANLVMHMPYLGWAELLLAGEKAEQVAAAASLRDMRDMVWKFQMTAADAGAEGPDLVGGIVFTHSSSLLPTSQSLRPLAFLATMMGDSRLTDRDETMREITKMLSGLRFVRQLAVDEYAAFDAAEPSTAMWGIRAAAWDGREAPEATALALLTVCEALRSLDEIARR